VRFDDFAVRREWDTPAVTIARKRRTAEEATAHDVSLTTGPVLQSAADRPARNSYGKDPSVAAADSNILSHRDGDSVATMPAMPARFVTMKQVAEELRLSEAQVCALVRSRDPRKRSAAAASGASNAPASRNGSSAPTATPNSFIDEHPFTGTSDKRTTSGPPPQEPTS